MCLSACLDCVNCGIVEHCCRVDSASQLYFGDVLNIVVELIVCLNCVLEMLDIQWRRLLVSYSCSSILCLGNIPFLQIFYNIPQIFKYSLDYPTVWVTVSGQFQIPRQIRPIWNPSSVTMTKSHQCGGDSYDWHRHCLWSHIWKVQAQFWQKRHRSQREALTKKVDAILLRNWMRLTASHLWLEL